MRRIRFTKILKIVLVIVTFTSFTLGCEDITKFDKNKNSYITEPYNTVDDSTQDE